MDRDQEVRLLSLDWLSASRSYAVNPKCRGDCNPSKSKYGGAKAEKRQYIESIAKRKLSEKQRSKPQGSAVSRSTSIESNAYRVNPQNFSHRF